VHFSDRNLSGNFLVGFGIKSTTIQLDEGEGKKGTLLLMMEGTE
jgi:hypothetical protein